MPLDKDLNEILKQMWSIRDKMINNEPLEKEEVTFFNKNLHTIKVYYNSNSLMWSNIKEINQTVFPYGIEYQHS